MEERGYLHRVQYYETDQMGIVHHSNYIRWFEEARTDFLRRAGAGYDCMEREGIVSPVVSVVSRYHSPARFGQTVSVAVRVTGYNGVRLTVEYRVKDSETGTLLCTGQSEHCFLKNGRPVALKRAEPEYDGILRGCLAAAEEEKAPSLSLRS